MGWADRPYQSDEQARRGWGVGGGGGGGSVGAMFGNGFSRHSIVFWLIIINAAVFFIDGILTRIAGPLTLVVDGQPVMNLGILEAWGYFSFDTTIAGFQIWRIITFQFLHAGLGHIFWNMLGLFFFGPLVERWWGSRRFLAFYLLTGVSGTVGYLALWASGLVVTTGWVPLVGASAGLFGVLIAAALIAPNTQVLLFFVIPIPLKVLIWGILAISVYTVTARGGMIGANAGGEAAHLGGAALGFLLVKKPKLLDWAGSLSTNTVRQTLDQKQAQRRRQREQADQAEVDRILDKVRDQGIQSLTTKEKKTLQQATDRQRRAG